MNKTKKIIGLLSMTAACLVGGAAFTSGVWASAENTIPKQGQMEGASIRYSQAGEDENKTGIRFVYRLDKEKSGIEANFSNIQNMGLLLAQTEDLNGADLTISNAASDTQYYADGKKVENVAGNTINVGNYEDGRFVLDENGDSYVLMVYIYNIPKEYYNTEFTSTGYVQLKDQDAITYTDSVSRSVSYVAKQAYFDKDYKNDTQKAWLENCLNKYTVTFNTGAGTAVDPVEVVEDSKLDASLASTMEGYTFEGWTNGGKEVDLATFTVTENCTLDANFKKTDSEVRSLNQGEALTLSVQTVSKITVNGQEISNYSVADGTLTIDGSAFTSSGRLSVRVYESAYVSIEYTVMIMGDVIAFSEINTDYALPVYNGVADYARANLTIVNNPDGMEGNFYKLTFDYEQNQYEAGIKIKPTLTKEEIQASYSEYSLVFNYYIDASNVSQVNILYNGAHTPGKDSDKDGVVDSDWGLGKRGAYTETYNQGVWNTAVIPVSKLLAYEEEFDNTTGQFTGNDTNVTILDRMFELENWTCAGQLLYFDWVNSAGEFYIGNFNLVKDVNLVGLEDGKATAPIKTGEATVAKGNNYTFDPAKMEIETTELSLSYWVDGVKNANATVALSDKEVGYQTTLTVVASDANGVLQTLYTETITIVDTSDTLDWNVLPSYDASTGLINDNSIFKHTFNSWGNYGAYGYWTNYASIVDEVPAGTNKTGSFYKVSRTSDIMMDGFKLTTNLTKEQLEACKDKYLQFDLYFNLTPDVTQSFTLGFMHNGTSFYEEVDYKTQDLMGKWQTVQIPVSYIIENYEVFSTLSADNSVAGNIVIMTTPAGSDGGAYTVEYYMSAPIIDDYDMSYLPTLSWNEVKFEQGTVNAIRQTSESDNQYYHVADYQNQGAFNGGVFEGNVCSVVSAENVVPEGSENTGSFYKIQFTKVGNNGEKTGYGLKIKLNIDKETLSLYKNGYVTFDIYAGIETDDATQLEGAGISYMALGNNNYLLGASDEKNEWSEINKWHTVKISVQSILDNYDTFATGGWTDLSIADNDGAIFVVHTPNAGWSTTALPTVNIYVSELKISA